MTGQQKRSELRVLQVNNEQLAVGGGVPTIMANEAAVLRGAGCAVELFELPATEHPGIAGAWQPTYNRGFSQQLRRRIETFRPDVVHVHTPFPLMSPAVFRTAKAAGCATVGTLHSFRYSCIRSVCLRDGRQCQDCVGKSLKWPGLVHRCYHDSYAASAALTASLLVHHRLGTIRRSIDRIIAYTEYARSVAVRDGMPAEKIALKSNFVPDPHPDLDVRTDSALFMGRLVKEKGIDHLLDAWRRHGDRLPRLVLAGDGEMRAQVEQAIAAGANITFLGWAAEDALERLLAECSLVVIPSMWHEGGIPMVMLRALAAARPSVVPDLANFHGKAVQTGAAVTYDVGDANSLAAAVGKVRAADQRLLRRAAREVYTALYTPERNLDTLLRIYAEACAESRLKG